MPRRGARSRAGRSLAKSKVGRKGSKPGKKNFKVARVNKKPRKGKKGNKKTEGKKKPEKKEGKSVSDWLESGQATADQFSEGIGMVKENSAKALMILDEAKEGIQQIKEVVSSFGDFFSGLKNFSVMDFDFHIAVGKSKASFTSAHWSQHYKYLNFTETVDPQEVWSAICYAVANMGLPALIKSKNMQYGGPYYYVYKLNKNNSKGLYTAIKNALEDAGFKFKEELTDKQKTKKVFGKKVPVPGTKKPWDPKGMVSIETTNVEVDCETEGE
mmetsp:Transcript_17728/g.26552  ORF Transcript_17728/g.26552 Transcript_17728/m.26552 type:complete len:271 (+) Transcript_17728:73-885(+)